MNLKKQDHLNLRSLALISALTIEMIQNFSSLLKMSSSAGIIFKREIEIQYIRPKIHLIECQQWVFLVRIKLSLLLHRLMRSFMLI